jgi:hypothetical protein
MQNEEFTGEAIGSEVKVGAARGSEARLAISIVAPRRPEEWPAAFRRLEAEGQS